MFKKVSEAVDSIRSGTCDNETDQGIALGSQPLMSFLQRIRVT
jgi:hypothetical protein